MSSKDKGKEKEKPIIRITKKMLDEWEYSLEIKIAEKPTDYQLGFSDGLKEGIDLASYIYKSPNQ